MAKVKTYVIEGRTFECYVSPSCLTNYVSVSIWEIVRPKWKIFRSKYRDSYNFWVFDYDTIDIGVQETIRSYLKQEWKSNCVCTKWEEFERG